MATYRVRRGLGFDSRVLRLGDRVLERGTEFDASEFPEFTQSDFDRWASHRLIESVDARSAERAKAERRHAAELARVRTELVAESRESVPLVCDVCGHAAKSEHGLKVHKGRKHKE